MNCLVTGATGFIGRHLVGKLLQRGCRVQAYSRRGGESIDSCVAQALDLADGLPVDMFAGVDVVFHLAGIAHSNASEADYEMINHRATLVLAEHAAAAGVKSFLFLSSVKAMGTSTSALARSEDDCSTPTDAYGLSKWRAECELRDRYSGGPMSVSIIRPVLVYGHGAKGNLRQLIWAARHGLPRPPAAGKRSVLALDDLAELLWVVASLPEPGVRTWIASGESYSLQQIYDQLRMNMGKTRGRQWAPRWLWRCAAVLLDLAGRGELGGTYDKLFAAEQYDSWLARSQTGWAPVKQLDAICADLLAGHSE